MRWQEIGNMTCSIGRALSVVGDRWTLLILRDAFLGVRRFEDFQADLGVTRHVLADRLRKLGEHGVLEKVQYHDRPPRHESRPIVRPAVLAQPFPAHIKKGSEEAERDDDKEDVASLQHPPGRA